jgi:hypothetical protein
VFSATWYLSIQIFSSTVTLDCIWCLQFQDPKSQHMLYDLAERGTKIKCIHATPWYNLTCEGTRIKSSNYSQGKSTPFNLPNKILNHRLLAIIICTNFLAAFICLGIIHAKIQPGGEMTNCCRWYYTTTTWFVWTWNQNKSNPPYRYTESGKSQCSCTISVSKRAGLSSELRKSRVQVAPWRT